MFLFNNPYACPQTALPKIRYHKTFNIARSYISQFLHNVAKIIVAANCSISAYQYNNTARNRNPVFNN